MLRAAVAEGARAGLVSTFQLSGTPDTHFYNCIAEIYYNYFNFAESKEEKQRKRACAEDAGGGGEGGATDGHTASRTSATEYAVDALALKADEGRGDRRNVQGELHASDEP